MKYTKEVLEDIVKKAKSLSDVCRRLDIIPSGGNIGNIKKRIVEADLDTSHFLGQGSNLGISPTTKKDHKEILIKSDKREKGWRLKRALIESGISYCCEICKCSSQWMDRELILVVDHINGDCFDHRKKNLRFLCPNCHSQTETFAGKNIRKKS